MQIPNISLVKQAGGNSFSLKKINNQTCQLLVNGFIQYLKHTNNLNNQTGEHSATHQVNFVQNSKTTTTMYKPSPLKLLCPLRDGSHQIFRCKNFKNMSIEGTHVSARTLGLCFNCMSRTHQLKDCLPKPTCGISDFSQRQITLLHWEKTAAKSGSVNVCDKQRARTTTRLMS